MYSIMHPYASDTSIFLKFYLQEHSQKSLFFLLYYLFGDFLPQNWYRSLLHQTTTQYIFENTLKAQNYLQPMLYG